jgi:4-amino-4-deoxy-L-arabinose transferase-like glycosyltransferase
MTAVTAPTLVRADRRTHAATIATRAPLFLILGLQAIVSLATLHNTAFQDEALYLYAGRQIIRHWTGGPAPLDHYAFYFSGYPFVYPVIGGFLDRVGGLELARSFSLVCMLGVTTIVYFVTTKIFDRPAAVFASAVYALTGVVLFLGRLATFDALCLFFITLATACAVHCATNRRPWSALAIGPVLVLAMLSKYAALLFFPPVIAILAFLGIASLGWRRTVLRVVLALLSLAAASAIAYVIVDHAAFHALTHSTTNRAAFLKAPRGALFRHLLEMGNIVLALAVLGVVAQFVRRTRLRLLALVLLGSACLAPLYHIYMREPISFDKHIAYGLFFAAPLAGAALAWLSGYERAPASSSSRGQWLPAAATVVVVFTLGLHQSHALYANWANTSALSRALHTQLRDGTGRIMAEDIEVARFDARDVTEEWQWNSFYYPYYILPDHQQIFGDDALTRGIDDRYYDLVELSFNYFPDKAFFLAGHMAETRNYDLIAMLPLVNSYGRGHFYVFRSALEPGEGNFKSIKQLKMHLGQ